MSIAARGKCEIQTFPVTNAFFWFNRGRPEPASLQLLVRTHHGSRTGLCKVSLNAVTINIEYCFFVRQTVTFN